MRHIIHVFLCIYFIYSSSDSTLTALKPEVHHPEVNQIVRLLLTQLHYNAKQVNDEFSEHVYESYLEYMDNNRSLFLKSDIESFEVYRFTFDDYLLANNLHPAYRMFNRYRDQRIKQLTFMISLLDKKMPNFKSDDVFVYDRREKPWFTTESELFEQWTLQTKNDILNLKLSNKPWKKIVELLKKRYKTRLKHAKQYNDEDVFSYFLNSVSLTFDPHTSYMSPRNSENFAISMNKSLEGIGAQLTSEGEFIKVARVIPGGPADRGKELQANDRIAGVAQGDKGKFEDVIGWRIDDVVQLIRGKKGSVVRLNIIPNGSTPNDPHKIVRIVRDKVKLEDQKVKSDTLMISNGDVVFKFRGIC